MLRALALLVLVLGPLPAWAQSLDETVIERAQRQLGVDLERQDSPLDESRSGRAAAADDARLPGGTIPRTETLEERELRRAQSRAQLDQLYEGSAVERDYWLRLQDRSLRQFGYDLFRAAESDPGALTGEVGDAFLLGIGDEVVVTFQGAVNDSETTRIDREGRLIVGRLRPVAAAGRTLGAVRAQLEAETRRTLLGTNVFVSVGSVRAITVFVGGEVERPGQYALTALADVTAALARAGGVRKSGSLRNVRLVRGGTTVAVDLYGLLGIGTPPAIRLRDGDRIIVPVIGDTAAIAGGVARPGIYELKGEPSIAQLIAYAGGAVRPRGYRVAVSRIGRDGTESFVRIDSPTQRVMPGDAAQVIAGSAGGAADRVILSGYVANPGPRSLSSAPTVRDLLGRSEDMRTGTYFPFALIVRRDALAGGRSYVPVSLTDALGRGDPVPLRSDDQLYVFSRRDIEFIAHPDVRAVVLGTDSGSEPCQSLQRLRQLVTNSQSLRFTAVTRGSFITSPSRTDARNAGAALNRQGVRSLDGEPQRADSAMLQQPRDSQLRTGQQADARDLPEERDEYADCPLIFEREPDLLPVVMEYAVGIGGAVRRPGPYPVAGPIDLATAAAIAEGLVGHSRDISYDITRGADGANGLERFAAGADAAQSMQALRIEPGQDVRFNAGQAQFENGAVLVSGEFVRPGLYTIRKGETLAQLIARAGGITELAYPYGAVFTRRAVKDLQEEGFRRTARELNSSLLALATRRETSGDAIAAVGNLIQSLSTVEAPGRMVVEADPRVLAIRTDLDTILEAGDTIYIPKRPNFVVALGDVNNPGALQFVPGKAAGHYVAEAGGVSSTADDDRAFLVLPNGSAQPLKGGAWRSSRDGVVPPGSTIIVPKNIDPLYKLGIARDIATIFGQLATAIAAVAILADNN